MHVDSCYIYLKKMLVYRPTCVMIAGTLRRGENGDWPVVQEACDGEWYTG